MSSSYFVSVLLCSWTDSRGNYNCIVKCYVSLGSTVWILLEQQDIGFLFISINNFHFLLGSVWSIDVICKLASVQLVLIPELISIISSSALLVIKVAGSTNSLVLAVWIAFTINWINWFDFQLIDSIFCSWWKYRCYIGL